MQPMAVGSALPRAAGKQQQQNQLLSLVLGWVWLLICCALCGVARGAPSIVFGDALAPSWYINGSFTGRYVDDSTFARSGSVYSIRADAFAFGALALSTTDRALAQDTAQITLHINPRGPSLSNTRSAQSLDVILAQSLPRGGGSTALVKLCTLNADFSEDLPLGVDVGITQNYLTNQQNAPGGAPGAAVGVCSVRKPPDGNGWYRVTLWLNPFTGLGWDMIQFRDALGTGATFNLDDIVLHRVADVPAAPPESQLWLGNAARCRQLMASVFYVCTVPPSNDCCGAFQAFNDLRCFCIQSVVQQGGSDLQVAKMFSDNDQCFGAVAINETDPSCFDSTLPGALVPNMPPAPVPGGGGGGPSTPSVPAVPGSTPSPPPRPPPPTPRVAGSTGPPGAHPPGEEDHPSSAPPPTSSTHPPPPLPPPPADSRGDSGDADDRAARRGLEKVGPYVAIVVCAFSSYGLLFRGATAYAVAEWKAEKEELLARVAASGAPAASSNN